MSVRIGEYNELKVLYEKDFGIYLGEEGEEKGILLPAKQVPEGTKKGDSLNVFVYRDSADRLIATTKKPLITLGEIAVLEVKDVAKMGAFLDWGMEKDLFLPFKEQTTKVNAGDKVPVTMYIDKSCRLCASMNIYKKLRADSPYRAGDEVTGICYGINKNIGAFIAVDSMYFGMIPNQAMFGKYRIGESYTFFVSERRNDGKLNLSESKKAYMQMDTDAEKIMKAMDEFGGELPFDESVSPETIKREFGISKAAFKRAVGKLLKEERITIEEGRIVKN